jgi:hypothetical protein
LGGYSGALVMVRSEVSTRTHQSLLLAIVGGK